MTGFVVYFFMCNIFTSSIICLWAAAKRVLRSRLSARMQYQSGFILFVLFALPFVPFRPSGVLSLLQSLAGGRADGAASLTNGITGSSAASFSGQISDFAISVSHKTPSTAGFFLCCVWFAGMFMMICSTMRSIFRLRSIMRSSLPLQNIEIRDLYHECLHEVGIRTEIPVYSTAYLTCPATTGLLKPRIYLPLHTLSDYDAASMRFMLLHELQHFKHKDLVASYLSSAAAILYWFNPFVRYALNEIKCDRETACDSAVLQMLPETEYEHYGSTLIDFAEKISRENAFLFPFSSGTGRNRNPLRKRIQNISDFRKPTRREQIRGLLTGILLIAVFLVLLPVLPAYAGEAEWYAFDETGRQIRYTSLHSQFEGFDGCFVLYDSAGDAWTIYNRDAALERIAPDSTYKIYSALLGLEAGIITPEHSEIAWNGETYPFHAWESDQNLHSAMRSSVNWYFQAVDHAAGMNRVTSYLQQIGYGNQQTSGDADLYWTDSSLKISPVEQVELLKKFYDNDFGFSSANILAVKEAVRISGTPDGALFGKTGTGRVDGQDTRGWFVGFIEKSGHVYYFATNIRASSGATGSVAAEISLRILSGMGLWENG